MERARCRPAISSSRIPTTGQPATEQTEVRILYTSDSLYMGVTCFDSEPDKWLGYQRRRDEFLQADDRFMWNIDTFNNQQSGYFFEMNPSGLMGDALRGANFNNRQWDGIWNAKVARSEIGWTLEIEIPFRTLNFDPNAEAWGINFQRTVRRKNEESVWTGWLRNQGLNRLSNAGLLVGLDGISQGRGLDIKPYVVGTSESFPGRGDARVATTPMSALDLFYSPTPGVRTNLTINTDFAQTEVDQRLINLTRFPQFFPEKRDFFLDGSTFFDFQSTAASDNACCRSSAAASASTPAAIRRRSTSAASWRGSSGATTSARCTCGPGEEDVARRGLPRAARQAPDVPPVVRRRASTPAGTRADAGVGTRHTIGADFLLATSTFRGSREPERRRVLRRTRRTRATPARTTRSDCGSTIRTIRGARAFSTGRFRRTTTRPSASRRAPVSAA